MQQASAHDNHFQAGYLNTLRVSEHDLREQLSDGTVYGSSGQGSKLREQLHPYPVPSSLYPRKGPLPGVRQGTQPASGQAKRGKPSQRSRRIANPIFLVLVLSLLSILYLSA
jgi:hypothetical protein